MGTSVKSGGGNHKYRHIKDINEGVPPSNPFILETNLSYHFYTYLIILCFHYCS